MREEAAKARKPWAARPSISTPAGTPRFASKLWDESRLGASSPEFVGILMLRKEFGLRLSLHTPLTGWCDCQFL